MKIIRCMASAFMLYSRIPVPLKNADEEDIKGAITFLPLVGFVIAALMYGLLKLTEGVDIPVFATTIITLCIPLIVTGGFHLDGFMDTTDALRSYRSKERKLEIMSDPHTGSFAVTGLVTVILLMLAGLGITISVFSGVSGPVVNMCAIFVISRAMAALTSIFIPKARQEGLLVSETSGAGYIHITLIMLQMAGAVTVMMYTHVLSALVILMAFVLFTFVYRHMTLKNFGGVTGDTAGYYVTVSETVAVCALAVSMLVTGR